MDFKIIENSVSAELLVEDSADEGVKKIADVIADDIESVCDKRPYIAAFTFECMFDRVIVFATVGKSAILSRLEEQELIDTSVIKDRKESFMITECEFSAIDADRTGQVLVVAGSDKRGTIYGMFKISEAIGVTSLVYWGDCAPLKQSDVMLTKEWLLKDRAIKEIKENIFASKQPSVEYRGFFINDEWPAFGGWSRDRFGCFNAKCYRELFIFLLRMRGNFLWPAMWTSVFSEDGPGIESARLADTLGIIMGTSHHEPLCRAGEEWQHIYKDYSESNAWNFISNREGIINFWRDGLLRNKKFENLITIGMRGEADSKLLGEDATMADNIKVVKDAILAQHELLKECINEDLTKIPRVLAIYKEVEDYYYGDETCEGLKDWDELKDVIFLLSDDNWANTRGLPKEEERDHPGGYGMYYHFDYHGGPISYEWQNTSRLSKIWEQMTQAYEYGVRREWIVNVGDLKGNEYPLTYFMALAYDYETWSGFDMIDTFVSEFIDEHFHADMSSCKDRLLRLIETATRYNALRKPEALNSFTYAPVAFNESRRVMDEVSELLDICEGLKDELSGSAKTAYMSMFYYQIKGSLNILLMQLEAGINAFLAKNRSIGANIYADRAAERTVLMGELIDEYNAFLGGKWIHMLESGHTGLRTWDDYDWGYPLSVYVNPIHKPKIFAYFKNGTGQTYGDHWQFGKPMVNADLTDGDIDETCIFIDSRGDVGFEYEVTCDKDWLEFEKSPEKVDITNDTGSVLTIRCDKTKLSGMEEAHLKVNIKFDNGDTTSFEARLLASPVPEPRGDAFNESFGIISIKADHYNESKGANQRDGYKIIKYLGREGNAVKCYPVTKDYRNEKDAPYLRYDVIANADGVYNVEVDVLSRNPVIKGDDMILYISANDGEKIPLNAVNRDFYAGHTCEQWCDGVLDNVRRIRNKLTLKKGKNCIYIHAGSPNVSFDRIILSREGMQLPYSYLGPKESYRA